MAGGILQAASWHLDGSWNSAAKPTTDDIAIVSENLDDDAVVIDTGHTAHVDLDLLQTHPQFAGDFGSSGSPIQTAADVLKVQGGGGFFMECCAASSAFKTDRAEIAAADPNTCVELGSVVGDAGDWVEIYGLRGRILLKGNIQFDAAGLVCVGQVGGRSDVNLIIDSNADTLAKLKTQSGTTIARNVVTDLIVAGGVAYKEDTKATTVDVMAGTLFYDHQAIAGDATVIRVWPGAMLHLWNNSFVKTITQLILMPGSTIVANEHPKLHIFTDKIDMGARWITSESAARNIASVRRVA